MACVVRAMRGLDFRVFPTKSEAIWFYDRNRKGTSLIGLSISMAGEAIEVRFRMKYLDLIIDSRWTSGLHFDLLISKVSAAVNALCGLCAEHWQGWCRRVSNIRGYRHVPSAVQVPDMG